MSQKWTRLIAGLAVGSMACGASGCLAVLAGAGGAAGYAYVKGEKKREFSQPVDVTTAAVEGALADLSLVPEKQRADKTGAVFKTTTANGTALKIEVEPTENPNAATVCVRAGTFGDEDISNLVYDRVAARLTQAPIQQTSASAPLPR